MHACMLNCLLHTRCQQVNPNQDAWREDMNEQHTQLWQRDLLLLSVSKEPSYTAGCLLYIQSPHLI